MELLINMLDHTTRRDLIIVLLGLAVLGLVLTGWNCLLWAMIGIQPDSLLHTVGRFLLGLIPGWLQ